MITEEIVLLKPLMVQNLKVSAIVDSRLSVIVDTNCAERQKFIKHWLTVRDQKRHCPTCFSSCMHILLMKHCNSGLYNVSFKLGLKQFQRFSAAEAAHEKYLDN